ncbi:MAG: PTS sugar transporter subunit IIB [Anaerolineaceae bacterium]|nr:PTS sugar transporter subunit IIB [Anaerolineaceae bacterium]
MSATKVILVSCGTAIATSTVVAKGIEEAMEERGINVMTRQCKAAEIKSKLSGIDLIVTTTPITDDLGIPIIHTLAFLTGMGKDEVLDQIEAALKD